MTTVELRFPAHRFHATAWGRHVNEGIPEWPPSPYRLMRALYDAWKRKYAEIPEASVEGLFGALATEAPRFGLPRAVASHTRSYLSSNSFDPSDKSLIFDAFVSVGHEGKCYLSWPGLELTVDQRELLKRLLGSLNYLGRSESWVEASLVEADADSTFICEPLKMSNRNGVAVPVACVVPKQDYRDKRRWLDALAYSTTDLIKEHRSAPPVLRMVQYVRPTGALTTHLPPPRRTHVAGPQAVLLGLDAPVLPLVTATVEVAEQVRMRLMGIHKRIVGDPAKLSARFSGKYEDGTPRQGHEHAFILPLGNDRGRIDRVLVLTHAKDGFQPDEMRAILGLRELYGIASDRPIRLVATGRGAIDDPKLRPPAATVVSTTPFVTARHWRKGRGHFQEFLKEEVRRECRNHRLLEPARVDLLERPTGLFEWVEYRRNRKQDPVRPGYGFRIEFAEPVPTPFSLGYGCHFGLGQFRRET